VNKTTVESLFVYAKENSCCDAANVFGSGSADQWSCVRGGAAPGNVSPPPSLWQCGNPAFLAGFPSAVRTVEKSLLLLDFSTVSMAPHFHNECLGLCSSAPSPFFRPQIPPKTQNYKFFEFDAVDRMR
jgi:hypothetical protein